MPHAWEAVGYFGTVLFASRFFVQWFKSEIEGRSVIPVAFWYISMAGGMVSLVYAIHIHSGPFIVGQGGGLFVYSRNLFLVFQERAYLKIQNEPLPPFGKNIIRTINYIIYLK